MIPFILKLAVRNGLRNKRRSAFTVVSLLLGIGLFVAAKGFVDGIEKTLVGTQIDAEHGHLRVVTAKYQADEDYRPLDIDFAEAAAVQKLIVDQLPGALTTTRVQAAVQIGNGLRSLSCRAVIADPAAYAAFFRIGTLTPPVDKTQPYAWLGKDLAAAFKFKVGDRLMLKAKTRPGAINAMDGVVIAGLIESGSGMTDNFTILLDAAWANEFLHLEPGFATEVFARFPDGAQAELADTRLMAAIQGLHVETWQEATQFVRDLNDVRKQHFYLVVFIVLLIGALSVVNTCLMSGFERTKEIGTLLAVGFPRGRVRSLFVLETIFVGGTGALIGAAIGGLASWWFSGHPIRLAGLDEVEGGMPMPPLLYFDFSPVTMAAGFGIGLVVATVAAMYPAWRSSRLDPITALREE